LAKAKEFKEIRNRVEKMIIDVHTHIYPDKIAGKVEEGLKTERGNKIPLCGPMTLGGLFNHMKRCGIEIALTFCVAEREKVVKSANDFIIGVTDNKRIIGFGTILPDVDDPRGEIRRLKEKGIKGIKFHSLFQELGAYDERLFPVYEEMGEEMIAFFHSGRDPADLDKPPRTTPEGIAKLKELFPKLKIVAAHLGGFEMLEEVEKWLLGKEIYIDTSWSPNIQSLDPSLFLQIVRNHGTNKVLFGTDYPTTTEPKPQIEWLMKLPLTEEEKERIFYKNAWELLKL
jgi:hypothetical protein